MSVGLTPSGALLLGLDAMAAEADTASERLGPPRDNWIMRVLVEELVRQAPAGQPADAAREMVHSQRGVTNRSVSPSLNLLIDAELIVASASGGHHCWKLSTAAAFEVTRLDLLLSKPERRAIRNAAHGANARAVAWSKTARASVELSCAT